MTAVTRTTCPYCGVGCGILATRTAAGGVEVRGDPDHPANFGRLCSKGSALAETLSLDDRLLYPLVDGVRASWDTALDRVATRFAEAIAVHGPEAVAFYVSGQILTEDYYVANKLMKGFIGAANIDTNSRLCMASSVAGHKRAFGADAVPGCYEDLEAADLVVLVGSNLAWCHPVLYQRIVAAREKRGGLPKVVVIDPRRTATSEIADMHLALKPDSDVALFNGLLLALAGGNATDRDWISRCTSGFRAAIDAARAMSVSDISRASGLAKGELLAFYDMFVRTERVVTVYSQGVNQSASGTDKVNAIINCHLATGRIGKPGMGPFSVTGQPNAMGGREVGGLANMLAAHMDIENAAHRAIVQDFWRAPTIATKPGLKAVDMFRAVGDGRIKAIWIMATNPVDSMPEADAVRAALAACPFVVVSDVAHHTDTTALGHVLLPSLAWGEKDGTVTNTERCISRQRAFLKPPGDARADWWQLAEVGKRMGFGDAFAWETAAAIFDDYARLTALANDGTRDLDLEGLAGLTAADYDALAPVQWPVARTRCQTHGSDTAPAKRLFANGQFYTPDGRARFVPTPYRAPAASEELSFVLNSGRIRDQWHTMTRTSKTARLMSHIGEPFVEVHPVDAARLGMAPAEIARIASADRAMLARVVVTSRQQPGSVFVPMHWTDQLTNGGRVDALVAAVVDPVSGQPALKQARVTVAAFPARWYAVAVTRERPANIAVDYWAIAPVAGGWRIEMADGGALGGSAVVLADLLPSEASNPADVVSYVDRASGQSRSAAFAGDRLQAILYVAAEPVAVSRVWLAEHLARDIASPADRLRLLAGRPGAGERDAGPIVCACFAVGANDIAAAVARGSTSIAAVGAATSAGTNCGSCRAEIGRLIHAARVAKAG
ncbi:MAG TPA: nitrate reductase [Hyphomicrobiaceae bacterium]|nr:nitrate reductase [Hyphomicrobiaceae bacterium]